MYMIDKDKRLEVRINSYEYQKLRENAKKYDMTVSQLVRSIIDSYIIQTK